jgi:hypothetical protein
MKDSEKWIVRREKWGVKRRKFADNEIFALGF